MSRLLLVCPPLTGHLNPLASAAQELALRGHDVRWVIPAPHSRGVLPPGAVVYTTSGESALRAMQPTDDGDSARGLRIPAVFAPLAMAMLPTVEAAVADFEPDLLVADQHAYAGPLAARRRGLPWVTSAATGELIACARVPGLRAWIDEALAPLQRSAGLEPTASFDLSPTLVVVYTTRELAGELGLTQPTRLVGAAVVHRADVPAFPWERLAPGRRVLVSAGTTAVEPGLAFYQAVLGALHDLPVQAVVSAPATLAAAAPPGAILQESLPQLALLPHVDAVVCHGGFNTVNEALAHGVPIVCAPFAFDHPFVAGRLAETGAGEVVRFRRARGAEIRRALQAVLDDPRPRAAAARLAAAAVAAGGVAAAADAIEACVPQRSGAASR